MRNFQPAVQSCSWAYPSCPCSLYWSLLRCWGRPCRHPYLRRLQRGRTPAFRCPSTGTAGSGHCSDTIGGGTRRDIRAHFERYFKFQPKSTGCRWCVLESLDRRTGPSVGRSSSQRIHRTDRWICLGWLSKQNMVNTCIRSVSLRLTS